MIRAISIADLGPLGGATTLSLWSDTTGPITISGPSRAGKSTIIACLLLALDGVGGPAVTDRARAGQAAVRLHDRSALRVRVTARGGYKRWIQDPDNHTTQIEGGAAGYREAHQDATGWDQTLGRAVLQPGYLLGLHPRDLAGVLQRAAGVTDLRSVVAELESSYRPDSDPGSERDAMRSRTVATKTANRAEGALEAARKGADGARAALEEVSKAQDPGDAPDDSGASWAREVAHAVRKWSRWDTARTGWERTRDHLEAWQQAEGARKADLAELGPEPESVDVEEAHKLWHDAVAAQRARAADISAWDDRMDRHRARQQEIEEHQPPGSADELALRARIREATGASRIMLCTRGDGCPLYLDALGPPAPEPIPPPEGERPEPIDLAADEERLNDAVERSRQRQQWLQARAQIGSPSPRPSDPGPPPEPPEGRERPIREDIVRAERILRQTVRHEAVLDDRRTALQVATEELERRTQAHTTAAQEAARMDRLVAAWRSAPAALADRIREALGDIGPCTLRWDGRGAYVDVDGRPATEPPCSTGELVAADAWLRVGLRRAVAQHIPQAARWPVVIDRAQDVVALPLPEAEYLLYLRTADGPLEVS